MTLSPGFRVIGKRPRAAEDEAGDNACTSVVRRQRPRLGLEVCTIPVCKECGTRHFGGCSHTPWARGRAGTSLPSPSFRVLPPIGRREGTRSTWRPVDDDTDDEDDDDEDATYERRHRELELLEHKGYDVLVYTLKRGQAHGSHTSSPSPRSPGSSSASTASPSCGRSQLACDERELRRAVATVVGVVPANACAACPPYYKHTPHTCEKSTFRRTVNGTVRGDGCCLACPPSLKHVAHTCGRSAFVKRHIKKRKW